MPNDSLRSKIDPVGLLSVGTEAADEARKIVDWERKSRIEKKRKGIDYKIGRAVLVKTS